MDAKEPKRARELRESLAERFKLPDAIVRDALVAVAGAVHERLPRSVRVAFLSLMPGCMSLLTDGGAAAAQGGRGVEKLEDRVIASGVPKECAMLFIAEMVRFISERCGTPLADALRRKIPEISAIEQQTAMMTGAETRS